jgi:hypothetical protein
MSMLMKAAARTKAVMMMFCTLKSGLKSALDPDLFSDY